MKKETLDIIKNNYESALMSGRDLITVLDRFREILRANHSQVDPCDKETFGLFLSGLDSCIAQRRRTFDLTNFVLSLSTLLCYIMKFMNTEKDKNWDLAIVARRKGLERDLVKILRKSMANDLSGGIRDRFGLRIILLNDSFGSEKELFDELKEIQSAIEKIVCGTDIKLREDFLDFVYKRITNPLISSQITTLLNLPYTSEFVKDYLSSPKKSGYKSLHFCLRVEYSDFYGGATVELQIRSEEMHRSAERKSGKYSHQKYEDQVPEEIRNIFHISDEMFTNIKIAGFTNYEPGIGDIDGIGSEKIIVNRRVSPTLASQFCDTIL